MGGNTNTNNGGGGGGGNKQTTLSLSDSRTFKRVSQTSSSTTLSGGTVVSVKQEGAVENLVPSYVDSTTFVNSPNVQQSNTVRQQSSTQNMQQRSGDDCESVTLPSKSSS
ncbi:hypothetical protein NQ314_014859 [Rhamnusium bicolor]|uniref:Uncharacterized protein n=1 Tax=Rhamnusium bicolor TaxID=1586634 RepID=A0AAV8X2J8_9CUCU|nr:hypothetical protein NQ314_014859 [Rhamnusium bicolor]